MKERSEREHREQVAFFTWAAYARAEHAELDLLFAVPNGGHRHGAVAAKLRAEGVRPGVPDVCLPVAQRGEGGRCYNALWIEMKAPGGGLRPAQRRWRELLIRHGGAYRVCRSWVEAREVTLAYLSGALPPERLNP